MAKWLITGDWQVDWKNIESCYRAHGNEIALAKDKKVKGIIDLGDLKEVYDPISQRVIDFQIHRWQNIATAGFERITLLGNHDRLGQYAEDRNWFSLFRALGVKAVDSPKVLDYGTVIFACLPYIRSSKKLIRAAKTLWKAASRYKRARRVLLFHCDVREAMYSNGAKSAAKVSTRQLRFHKYHYCFGGHIHSHQRLTDNSMYVGNPFCCDWGEKNTPKGFVIYDDQENTVKFEKSTVPGWYSYEWLCEHKIKQLPKGSRIQDEVDCPRTIDYHRQIETRRLEIKKAYPDTLIYVKPRFAKAQDAVAVVDIASSDKEKFRSYISAVAGKSIRKRKDKVLAYLESVLGKVPFANTRSESGIRFKSVHAENTLSFKELDFSYENRGVCLVEGINHDWPKHSNGAGKTNFLSVLPLAVSGQTLKGQKTDDWVNEKFEKKAKIHLICEDSYKRKIEIIRQRKPTKLQLLVDGKDESTGRNHKGKRETQGLIEDILGFDFETLKSSVYIDASLPKAFIEGTQKTRTDIISRIQNLDRFELARKIASKDLEKINEAIQNLQEEISIEEVSINETEEQLAGLKTTSRKNLSKYKKEIKLSIKEVRLAKAKLKTYKRKTKIKYNTLIKRFEAVYDKQRKLEQQDYALCLDIQKHKKFLVSASEDDVCPTCGQVIKKGAKEHVIREHKQHFEELSKTHSDLIDRISKYKGVYKELKEKIATIRRKTEYYSERLSIARGKRSSAQASYRAVKRILASDLSVRARLEHNISESKKKIEKCRETILAEEQDSKLISFAVRAFSRNGIPLYLNGLACPLLNRAADEYSQMFTDGEIQVQFDLEEGEFVSRIINAHGSVKTNGQSVGEKAWAGFICSLALCAPGPKTNVLILDEPGYGMDDESTKVLGAKLPELASRFETVLVVSHNANIAAALQGDSTITIEKKHKVSTISSSNKSRSIL